MLSAAEQQRLYEALLNRYGQEIADAFAAAVADLQTNVDFPRLVRSIGAGDVQGAVDALHLDPAVYGDLLDRIVAAFAENGRQTAMSLPALKDAAGAALVVRFNSRNLRAEAWLRDHGAALVTRIVGEQRQAVRQALVGGMEAGENPRATALRIVGHVDNGTGKREGGVIGLTAAQQGYAEAAREELASADPAALRNYLARERRDARFDRSIERAIRQGRPLERDIAEKAAVAYERRLLQLRGEMIGRTEALASLNAGQFEALRQAVESGALTEAQVRRVWKSASDSRVRDTHRALHGESVGLNESFRSPSGAVLRFPGDPRAPAAEIINCRCWVQPRIDYLANLR